MAENSLGAFVSMIGGAGIIAALIVYVTYTMKTQLGSASADVNTTFDNTITASKDTTSWFPIIVVGAMATVVLGFFVAKKRGLI